MKTQARILLLGGVAIHLLGSICPSQEGVRWEALSLQAAQQRAAQTRRLVLVHFWSPNCGPCQKMDRLVFSRPDVAAAVETYYVPVKINVDQFPYTARQFGITALPTDLILSPNGQVIRRFQGAVPAEQYIAQLQQVAGEMQLAGTGIGPGSPGVSVPPVGPPVSRGPSTSPPSFPMVGGGEPTSGTQHSGGGVRPPVWPPSWSPSPGAVQPPITPPSGEFQNPQIGFSSPERDGGANSGLQPPSSYPPSSGPPLEGLSGSGIGPRLPENPVPPLADRTMVPASPGQLASQPPSPRGDAPPPRKTSGVEATPQQGEIGRNLPIGTDFVRAENSPAYLDRRHPPGAGTPMLDGPSSASENMIGDGWPPGLPPLGLEGYCPVELVEKRRWVLGTHPWGVIHEGRTYMCAGPEEQKKFLANPERYAPVLSGHDVVWAVERGQQVPGRREYGVFYRGRVYLFAEPATLDAFRKNPRRYLEAISAISSTRSSETASR